MSAELTTTKAALLDELKKSMSPSAAANVLRVIELEANEASEAAVVGTQIVEIFVATDGGTSSATEGTDAVKISPVGTIATHTVNFPDSPVDGQKFGVMSNGEDVTALAFDATDTSTKFRGAATEIVGGVGSTYIYSATDNDWARV